MASETVPCADLPSSLDVPMKTPFPVLPAPVRPAMEIRVATPGLIPRKRPTPPFPARALQEMAGLPPAEPGPSDTVPSRRGVGSPKPVPKPAPSPIKTTPHTPGSAA